MFPLPLTPFEYYYWCDDRPEYPTAYAFELTFRGLLDRELVEQALAAAYVRHPLLQARIEDNGGGACWIEGSAVPPPIDWAEDDVPMRHSDGPRIDLARSAGLRVWVRHRGDDTLVRLQFHHACGDGLGALRFIEDLLLAYHQLSADRHARPKLPRLASERLPERGVFMEGAVAENKWRKQAHDIASAARQWASMLLRPAAPLAIPRGAAGENEGEPALAFTTAVLDEQLHQRLRETARRRGATLNDLLLCELFRTLGRWNAEHIGKRGPLRINVPVSFRTPRDRLLPMANRLSFAFLTRSADKCDDGAALLDSIRAEMQWIKQQRVGMYFLGGLGVGRLVPGLVRWSLSRPFCFATICLSNLGRVLSRTLLPRDDAGRLMAGGAVLVRVCVAPPIRPLTRAAIAVIQYGGETTLNLRVDPTCLSRCDAATFLEAYLGHLHGDA